MITLDGSHLGNKAVMAPFIFFLIVVTGAFCVPLLILLYVQTLNFMSGKTTMERFGRSRDDSGQPMRMLNNGIQGDAQIYKRNISRPASRIQSNYSQEES